MNKYHVAAIFVVIGSAFVMAALQGVFPNAMLDFFAFSGGVVMICIGADNAN